MADNRVKLRRGEQVWMKTVENRRACHLGNFSSSCRAVTPVKERQYGVTTQVNSKRNREFNTRV